jgi:hypothetical protein
MGIEEGEEMQAKWSCNIFNKIITENLPKSRENYAYLNKYSKPPGHQTDLTKIELLHDILSIKQQT